MNIPSVPTPNTPPTIKGAIGSAGKEIADIGQNATKGLQNAGAQIRSNLKAGQSSYNARTTINPVKGTARAFMSAFKK